MNLYYPLLGGVGVGCTISDQKKSETRSFLIHSLPWHFLKKIAVILLMGTLLFNWFGYQFLTHYLQQQADRQLETRLDKEEYDAKDLVTIKIPLHLPYITDRIEYTR